MKLLLQELTQYWIDSDSEDHSHQKQMHARRNKQRSLQWYL